MPSARIVPSLDEGEDGQAGRRPQARGLGQTERNESAPNNHRLTIMAALVPTMREIRFSSPAS